MKFKRFIALCMILVLCLSVSSCGYRLVKVEDLESTTAENGTTANTQNPVPEETTLPTETTTDPADFSGITVNSDYRSVAMSKEEVADMYARAVNDVKLRCPGFTCTSHQEISDVKAGNGGLQLADRILHLVASEVIKNNDNLDYNTTVQPYDDISVREYFPVFGEDYACEITDYSIITSAACYTNGAYYKLVLTVADTLNPEPKTSQFGKIMTPIERKPVADAIAQYVPVLDMKQYQFDINYTGNEITCLIECATNRIVSMTQKTIMQIEIDLNLDLIVFYTTMIEASGTVINHLSYDNFVW